MGLRRVRDEGAIASMAWGNVLAFALAAPFSSGPAPGVHDLGIVLFLGVFQLGLAYASFSHGLRQVPAVEASLLILLEPVLNAIWAALFAGEIPGPLAIAGGAVILVATVWRTVGAAELGRRGAAPRVEG
jgi:DME family drug/metabolite transporter